MKVKEPTVKFTAYILYFVIANHPNPHPHLNVSRIKDNNSRTNKKCQRIKLITSHANFPFHIVLLLFKKQQKKQTLKSTLFSTPLFSHATQNPKSWLKILFSKWLLNCPFHSSFFYYLHNIIDSDKQQTFSIYVNSLLSFRDYGNWNL